MKEYKVIGKSVRKLDAAEKATGTAGFTSDIKLPGMLYGKVLRSPHPHARIASIDTTEAEKLPGVKAVATYKNTSRELFNTSATMTFTVPPEKPVLDQYIFDNVVRYVGDEVAAVAATTEKIAEAALRLIKVEYEPLPTVYDPKEAMTAEAPVIHECKLKNIPGEVIQITFGEVEKGFKESDVIVDKEYYLPVVKQTQMETQAAVAQVGYDGKITVWSTTQTPHPTKIILAKIFQVPESKVRVLNPPYIGGGFGVRIGLSAKAEPIAVAISLLTKKPVKVVYSRKEDFIASDTRHAGYVSVKLGAKKDGTFHSMYLKATLNGGAYCSFSVETPGVLGCMGLAVYRVPNQFYYGHSVYTNTTPAGAMRAFGNPQAILALESTVDIMAEKLGMDPLELRLKNIMQVGDPWVLPYKCGSTGLAECIEKGAKSIGWENRDKLNKPGAKKLRGIGMAVGTHVSNAWPFCGDYDNAYVTVQQDGTVHLASGVPDMGTGTSTTLPQLVAEVMGVGIDQMSMTFADTASTPYDVGSHASRTLYAAGTAVVAAAKDARKQVLEYAADLFKVAPERLVLEDSAIYPVGQTTGDDCKGSPVCTIGGKEKKRITLKELAHEAHLRNKQFIGVGRIVPDNAPPWHAHFAEVEVDTELGQIKVLRMAAAHDAGKVIHPVIVEGQVEGAILQGVGYALGEEIKYDEKGRQLHDSFHKYMQPTVEDRPEMEIFLVETYEPTGPFGGKGVGECALVPTAPAITNAIYNATGVRFYEIPVTEEKMFKALKEQASKTV